MYTVFMCVLFVNSLIKGISDSINTNINRNNNRSMTDVW